MIGRALIHVPASAKRGEIIEIKALISHVMETGYRIGITGQPIPRDIIEDFVCTYNGEEVFRAKFSPAIAANPFMSVLHRRDRKRHDRILLDRSARRDAGADCRDHGGMNRLAAFSASLVAALLATGGAFAAEIPPDQRRSDSDFISADTRAMQNDDTANPGMLAVLDGEAIWNAKDGRSGKSCADCHGDAAVSMKGVAARYPSFSAALNRPVDLEQRINLSRTDDQKGDRLHLRKQGIARAHRLCRASVARHARCGRGNRPDQAVYRSGPSAVRASRGATQFVMRAMPRR